MDNIRFLENNIWENNSSEDFKIIESLNDSEVDGKYILARVEGPAFFPQTTSRNNIFYPLEAWEAAISNPEFVTKLRDRLVYGTIGHDPELDDNDIREGKHSHIVTRVWINEDNVGMAEYLILNTSPGQNLNNLLRVKSKLRVSTRAEGFFADGKNPSKTKSIIPESFRLNRIDFVIDPGYLQALPSITESNSDSTNLNNEGINMAQEATVVSILESRVNELKGEKSISEAVAKDLQTKIQDISESNAKALAKLAVYESLGSSLIIQEELQVLAQYRLIGSVQEIHEALEEGEQVIDDMSGKLDELQELVPEDGVAAEYQELGEPGDIKTALDQAVTAINLLAEYQELGSVDEIQELIDKSNEMVEDIETQSTSEVASQFNVDQSIVQGLLDKGLTLEEVIDLLDSITQRAEPVTEEEEEEETPEQEEAEEETPEQEKEEAEEEEEEETPNFSESRSSKTLQRMMSSQKVVKINESKGIKPAGLAARLFTTRR